jgi:hypothetical protein
MKFIVWRDGIVSDYFECTPVGLEFLEQKKNVFKAEEIINASPEVIYEVFEDPLS